MATPNPIRAFLILSSFSALYVLSLFYRVSNAVIAPNLCSDLGLNAETLGILGGSYFYSFALFQIPLGPMLDRISPRVIVACFSLIGATGAFLFGSGQSFTAALFGKALNGAGMACVLMGALKVFTLEFPARKFTTLMGIMVSIGMLGTVLAASPLAYLTFLMGWRMIFLMAGVITILLAFLLFWILRENKPKGASHAFPGPAELKVGVLPSVRLVLGSLLFWQGATITFFRYGTFVSLQGLWLGPYLMEAKGYSPVQTGHVLILLAIGMIIGASIAGKLSDRTFPRPKRVILGGLSLYCLSLFPLVGTWEIQGSLLYGLIFFFIGFFNSFGIGVFSHVKETFPKSISGTVLTLLNFFTVAGAAVFMQSLGTIIEFFPKINGVYPARAYHLCFLVCFVAMAASLFVFTLSKKGEGREKYDEKEEIS